MKLKKKQYGLIIGALFIIGAVINFYSTNMVMNTICNKGSPKFILLAFPSLAMLTIAIEFVVGIFFFLRLYLHPTHTKRMLFVYGILLICFSGVGLVCDILSGTLVYGRMTIAVPFAGGLILFLFWHLMVVALGIVMIVVFRKRIEDPDIIIQKTNTKHVFLTIFWSLVIFYGMNRLGAFLWSPSYITWSTFFDTYPFYLSLLLLPAILLNILLYVFNIYKQKNAVTGISISASIAAISLVFVLQVIVRGRADQAFIAAISPALPIERLTTKPIDIILQAVSSIALALFTLNHSLIFKRLKDKETAKESNK